MRRFFESNLFPTGKADFKSNWVSRTPTKSTAQAQQTKSQPHKQPLTQQEERDLNRASNSGDRIEYALAMLGVYMVRKAPQYGLDINDAKVAAFYGKGLDDLCADVETDEVWPTIQEAEAQFIQVLGRAMTGDERQFMKESLAVLNDIAPDSYPAVFRNASDFYEFRAYHWLDSECGYDDYEYAFEMGMAGNPEDDWTEMMGGYNHAGEYLECAYAFGQDSGKFFKLCGI